MYLEVLQNNALWVVQVLCGVIAGCFSFMFLMAHYSLIRRGRLGEVVRSYSKYSIEVRAVIFVKAVLVLSLVLALLVYLVACLVSKALPQLSQGYPS